MAVAMHLYSHEFFNHTSTTRYETILNYLLNSNIVSTQKVINMVVIVTQKLAVYLQITSIFGLCFMVFDIFNNISVISWWSVLLEETGENHQPASLTNIIT
jgi:hypothetical protein